MKNQTLLAQAGTLSDNNGSICVPIDLSVTFEKTDGSDLFYSVFNNPVREQLEQALIKMENGADAIAFSSGSAAIASVFSSCKPGDHIIVPDDVFQGTARLLNDQFNQWGLQYSFVDMKELASIEAAVTSQTKIIWVESPSNPLMRLTDFSQIVALAKRYDLITICDNTYLPFIQQPLNHGIDGVVYSTTKFINGHNDTVGGVFVSKHEDKLSKRIRKVQQNCGAIPSPFESWLTLRGLRTLPLRVKAQSDSALQIVNFLHGHEKINDINYPTTSPLFDTLVMNKQLQSHFGGMLSFELDVEAIGVDDFLGKLTVFRNATSFGGVVSLVEDRSSSPIQNIGSGTGIKLPDALIRISVGLEDPDDLIEDLTLALK